MNIKQYRLIHAASSSNLAEAVNELISRGWQPYGSPFSATHEHHFFQAMTSQAEAEAAKNPLSSFSPPSS